MQPLVELRAARIPVIGWIAHHHWLTVNGVDRWEVWQRPAAGGESWGHLHRNLLACDAGVGNGPSWVVATWQGVDAAAIVKDLAAAPKHYPWRDRYHYWPGPNSNTFVQWVLQDRLALGAKALGKGYVRFAR